MYIKKIEMFSYGPIKHIEYSFRFLDNGKPVPLVVIGKNGSGKTLLFSSIVDSIIETKRNLYNKILEVENQNYYKMGSQSYIQNNSNTAKVKIESEVDDKVIQYVEIMSRKPSQAETMGEVTDQAVLRSTKFKENGFYRNVEIGKLDIKSFRKGIQLFFPFDRFYKPLWYNPSNYNRVAYHSEANVGNSPSNLLKIDILENISDWIKDVYMQSKVLAVTVPNDERIQEEIRGKTIPVPIESEIQKHLKHILATIKGDGPYNYTIPTRNHKQIGISGQSINCYDLSQLSAGELALYSIAASIIKEWDIVHDDDNVKLEDIVGCVIIDEADANLHIDFAYRALPTLMKMFPKIQFIMSTHSPFLLAGLKETFGDEIDMFSLPSGELVKQLNSFSEITEAYRVFNMEIDRLSQQNEALCVENERIKGLNNKIVIYTEGKTDVKYLKLALERLGGFDDIKSRIDFYDIESAQKTGDAELYQTFEYLQKGTDSNIKICIFDRDCRQYILNVPFERGKNKVYRFNIPIPTHRNKTDLISIEHYLTDEEIKTVDSHGRRVFLSGEFNAKGISKDRKYTCAYCSQAKRRDNPLEILDGSGNKKVFLVESDDEINYALTKDDFVQHIIDKEPGFDKFSFESFKKIFDIIKEIVQDSDGE